MRFFVFISILLFSCHGKPDLNVKPEAPAGLIEQAKFTNVMLDMQLLEAMLKLKLIRKKDIRQRTPGYYEQVFSKHEISEEQFLSSLDYYSLQQPVITAIYDSVKVELVRMKEDIETGSEKVPADSIPEKNRNLK